MVVAARIVCHAVWPGKRLFRHIFLRIHEKAQTTTNISHVCCCCCCCSTDGALMMFTRILSDHICFGLTDDSTRRLYLVVVHHQLTSVGGACLLSVASKMSGQQASKAGIQLM